MLDCTVVSAASWRVEQQRYLTDPAAAATSPASPYQYRWDVPVNWVSSGNSTLSRAWLQREDSMIAIAVPHNAAWLKLK